MRVVANLGDLACDGRRIREAAAAERAGRATERAGSLTARANKRPEHRTAPL